MEFKRKNLETNTEEKNRGAETSIYHTTGKSLHLGTSLLIRQRNISWAGEVIQCLKISATKPGT